MSYDPHLPPETSQNETSILAIHKTVMEEAADPHEAIHAGPRWFYYFIVTALIVGSFYLGKHMGEYGTQTHIGFLSQGLESSPAEPQNAAGPTKPAVSGASIFKSRCISCHQANGLGVPGAFPPLVGSPYVLEDPRVTVAILLKGLQGPLEVKGAQYNGLMPPWADQLKDAEIAAVTSYIRSELGDNKADPIDEAFVAKLREELKERTTPYTATDLATLGAEK